MYLLLFMLSKQLNIPVSNVNLPNKLEFINSYNDSKINNSNILSELTINNISNDPKYISNFEISKQLNYIDIKLLNVPTLLAAIDSTSIHIGNCNLGSIFSSRITIVFSYDKQILDYIRLGPIITLINENTVDSLADNSYVKNMLLSHDDFVETYIRNKLEFNICSKLFKLLNKSIILIDGCLYSYNEEIINNLVNKNFDNKNNLIGISKTSKNKSVLHLSDALSLIDKSPIFVDITNKKNLLLNKYVKILITKLSNDNLIFRTDILSNNSNHCANLLSQLLFNDVFSKGYPDSLRLAHHLSIFNKLDIISIKMLLKKKFDVNIDYNYNRRNTILGSIKS